MRRGMPHLTVRLGEARLAPTGRQGGGRCADREPTQATVALGTRRFRRRGQACPTRHAPSPPSPLSRAVRERGWRAEQAGVFRIGEARRARPRRRARHGGYRCGPGRRPTADAARRRARPRGAQVRDARSARPLASRACGSERAGLPVAPRRWPCSPAAPCRWPIALARRTGAARTALALASERLCWRAQRAVASRTRSRQGEALRCCSHSAYPREIHNPGRNPGSTPPRRTAGSQPRGPNAGQVRLGTGDNRCVANTL